jgi:hypothetical protein
MRQPSRPEPHMVCGFSPDLKSLAQALRVRFLESSIVNS